MNKILLMGSLCLVLCSMPAHAQSDLSSPVGVWKTVDDKSGQPRGFVRIYESQGKFFGKIERSLDPTAAARVCKKCSDERKDQPIIGLVIIRNMEHRGDDFSGGDILDPDSGTVYSCKFRLEDHGQRLSVRGFLGLSLFGRSQNWYRENPGT